MRGIVAPGEFGGGSRMIQTFCELIRDDSADYQVAGIVESGNPQTWALHWADPARESLAIVELRIYSLGEWESSEDCGLDLAPLLQVPIRDRIAETTRARLEALARALV